MKNPISHKLVNYDANSITLNSWKCHNMNERIKNNEQNYYTSPLNKIINMKLGK